MCFDSIRGKTPNGNGQKSERDSGFPEGVRVGFRLGTNGKRVSLARHLSRLRNPTSETNGVQPCTHNEPARYYPEWRITWAAAV